MNIKLHDLPGCQDIHAKLSRSNVSFISAQAFTTNDDIAATATEYSTAAIRKPVVGEIMTVMIGAHSFDIISTFTPADIISAMTAAGVPASIFACILYGSEIVFRSTNKFNYSISTKGNPDAPVTAAPTLNIGILAMLLLLPLFVVIIIKLLQ